MVHSTRHPTESFREARSAVSKEKAAFSRRATQHILSYGDEVIPPVEIENPSRILRLWLETFPDLATNSLGKHATRIALHVEVPGQNPLVVQFNRLD